VKSAKKWDVRTVRIVVLEIHASDAVTICRRMDVSPVAGVERMVAMAEYVKIYCCGDCGYYDWKKHKCKRGAEIDDGSRFFRDCPIGIHEEKDDDEKADLRR